MADCWPPCSPFCECIDGDCQPSRVQINAVRLRMADGRYLVAAGGGGASLGGNGAALIASNGGNPQWQTFLFVPPAAWPFGSGDPFALAVCDSDWNASTNLVRVYHTGIRRRAAGAGYFDSYVLGGEDGGVFVNAGFSAGPPAYSGSDPLETDFSIIKSGGGTISHGDTVFIRVAQSDTDYGPFFFRVNPSGFVDGDGTDPAAAGAAPATPFIVEFLEMKGGGVGPRPNPVICRRCATVSVTVTDAGNHNPLPNASVKASGSLANQPFVFTARHFGDGVFTFAYRTRSGMREVCVPEGEISLLVTEDRHKSFSGTVSVPAAGGITVPIELVCTKVSGFVVNDTVPPTVVSDAIVSLTDSLGHTETVDVNPDGTFTFECVKQGVITVADAFAAVVPPFPVGPEGRSGVVLVEHINCAYIDGRATDDGRNPLPIKDVKVAVVGTTQSTSTDITGYYKIPCVAAGSRKVEARKAGYRQVPSAAQLPTTVVPTTGSVTQDLKLRPIPLVIWNTGVDDNNVPLMPGDSDPHWNVVNGPGIAAPQKAMVLTSPPGSYHLTLDSRWIWVTADGIGSGPGDFFTFKMQFDLGGFDPASVRIDGAWSVDNFGTITLNSTPPVGTGTFSMSGDAFANFDSEHPFTISSGFVAGVNSLEVQMANFFGPSSPENPQGFNVTKLTITGTRLP